MPGSRAISEPFAAIVVADRRTIHHRHHTADLDRGVSFGMEPVASGCERTLDVVKSRGKDDASISGIRDRRPSKCERRLSHLDIELLRSCGMRVSSGRVVEVKRQTHMKLSSQIPRRLHLPGWMYRPQTTAAGRIS